MTLSAVVGSHRTDETSPPPPPFVKSYILILFISHCVLAFATPPGVAVPGTRSFAKGLR